MTDNFEFDLHTIHLPRLILSECRNSFLYTFVLDLKLSGGIDLHVSANKIFTTLIAYTYH